MKAKGQMLNAEVLFLQPSAFILHPYVMPLPAILPSSRGFHLHRISARHVDGTGD